MRIFALAAILALTFSTQSFGASTKEEVAKRLGAAQEVLEEMMLADDQGIPQDLLEKAKCAVVVPGMKRGGFIVAAKYGKGFISCRPADGAGWGAPGAVRIEGGSVGFQIGASESDIIMLVMNDKGAEKLLQSKFTLGGEGTIAAGPVGRDVTAQTDAQMRAEILSWSRSRGAFAGVSLAGATLRSDADDNAALYGKQMNNKDVVMQGLPVPAEAKAFIATLTKFSGLRR